MVTKNYAKFCACASGYVNASNIKYHLQIKDLNGVDQEEIKDNFYLSDGYRIECFIPMIFNSNGLKDLAEDVGGFYSNGMFVGKGTTPVTKNDYKLADMINYSDSGLSVVSTTVTHMPDTDTLYTYVRAIKNNGTEPITISETGLIVKTIINDVAYTFLWARDTFEPVTLEPGDTRAFTMTIGLE